MKSKTREPQSDKNGLGRCLPGAGLRLHLPWPIGLSNIGTLLVPKVMSIQRAQTTRIPSGLSENKP